VLTGDTVPLNSNFPLGFGVASHGFTKSNISHEPKHKAWRFMKCQRELTMNYTPKGRRNRKAQRTMR